jgi:putative ABC transport system permease protein
MLLSPLPYADPDRLVYVSSTQSLRDRDQMTVSFPDFREWSEQNRSFEGMSAFIEDTVVLTGADEPLQMQVARVTAGFFSVLGITPVRGRGFQPEEEQVGRHRVVVLSQGLWARQFGSDPSLVGREIALNGRPYTVVGIAPTKLQLPHPGVEAWVPLALGSGSEDRGTRFLTVIARLKSGQKLSQAGVEMRAIAAGLAKAYPENDGIGAVVVPLADKLLGAFRPALWLLFGAVVFVLLIACANVANLLLARSASRRREIALRTALGAGRGRLMRQLLTESMLLALLGGALGTLLATWALQFLLALAPADIPRLTEAVIDGRVLAFTAGLSLLTGAIFGLLPAWQATSADPSGALKDGIRGAFSSLGGRRMLKLLVIGEVALSLMLLVGAGLLANSFERIRGIDPGFNPRHLLTVPLSISYSKYPEPRQRADFLQQVLNGIGSVPGVISVGATNDLPFASTEFNRYFMVPDIDGETHPTWSDQAPMVAVFEISPDYFRAMGTPLRAGRFFDERDDAAAAPTVIVNEALARRYFPGGDPIGRRIRTGAPGNWLPWMTIVGVVGETRLEKLTQEPFAEVYTAHRQGVALGASGRVVLALRTTGDPASFAAAVKTQVQAVDRSQPLGNIRTMEDLLSRSLVQPRFQTILLGLLAILALVLAAIGIYGMLAYSVRVRTSEIGIRVALGARAEDILRLILGEGSVLILIGIGAGAMGALALSRLLSSFLYGVTATDPLTFLVVSMLLAGVGLLASYLPARRASKVDPMVALRFE